MKLLDIKAAVVSRIKVNIPEVKVIAEEVEQGFKKPAFFVQTILIGSEKISPYQMTRSVMIMIRYHSDSNKTNENLSISDSLEEAFKASLKIDDRRLTIENVDSEIIDKVLHFRFDLLYIDSVDGFVITDPLGKEQVVHISEQEEDNGYSNENIELMKELIVREGE